MLKNQTVKPENPLPSIYFIHTSQAVAIICIDRVPEHIVFFVNKPDSLKAIESKK